MACSTRSRRRSRLALAPIVAAVALAVAPAALADTAESSNWAGYAVHRSGLRFHEVVATWRQPNAVCSPGTPTFSSIWVGIGGYALSSQALEQIGSEVDCNSDGHVVSSAWYELVPSASRTIHLKVSPGDRLNASVTVTGRRVRVQLKDLTRRTSFTRTIRARIVDVGSADWIVEAPSECTDANSCQTLSLADFGSASFSRASATTASGHTGTLSDRHWKLTKIVLTAGQRHFIGGPTSSGAQATPSSLSSRGSAFTVDYRASSSSTPTTSNARREAFTRLAAHLRPGEIRAR